ncbi:hypothetical protein Tco_0228036 [Tanacetum coccineum]
MIGRIDLKADYSQALISKVNYPEEGIDKFTCRKALGKSNYLILRYYSDNGTSAGWSEEVQWATCVAGESKKSGYLSYKGVRFNAEKKQVGNYYSTKGEVGVHGKPMVATKNGGHIEEIKKKNLEEWPSRKYNSGKVIVEHSKLIIAPQNPYIHFNHAFKLLERNKEEYAATSISTPWFAIISHVVPMVPVAIEERIGQDFVVIYNNSK